MLRAHKRFTSTGKWRDPWFRSLRPNTKLVFVYLLDTCDAAGVWEPDFARAEAEIGFAKAGVNIAWNQVFRELNQPVVLPRKRGRPRANLPPPVPAQRVMLTQTRHWWVSAFCQFQYGTLRPDRPNHVPALRSLARHDLLATYAEMFPDGIAEGVREGALAQCPFPKARPLPTLEVVRSWPEAQGISEAQVLLFYHHYAAAGWRQPNGRLHPDFRALLVKWRSTGDGQVLTDLTAATADSAQARIEAIDRRLQELKQDLFSPHPAAAPQIRPESLAEMARLESEKATLQALPPHGDLPNQQI